MKNVKRMRFEVVGPILKYLTYRESTNFASLIIPFLKKEHRGALKTGTLRPRVQEQYRSPLSKCSGAEKLEFRFSVKILNRLFYT